MSFFRVHLNIIHADFVQSEKYHINIDHLWLTNLTLKIFNILLFLVVSHLGEKIVKNWSCSIQINTN